jgi:ABC-type multidrug transport system fused ATPase/permease subunit
MLVLLRLIRYSPRYFFTCVAFAIVIFFCLPIPLGLASQAFFDALAAGSTGLSVWSAIAVMMAVQIAEVFTDTLLGNPWNALQQKSRVLLQRNMLAGILRGYGKYGLPTSVGESISRFRDDPDSIADGLDAVCDLIGRTFFAVGAVVVMWRVDPTLTLVLCVPLLLSAWLTEALGTKTMAYRASSHAATSRLTGFLGELLGAHLAVTVAGASGSAVARLNEMGEARRRVAVRDSVFDVLLDSFSINIGHVGAGLVLLLGAQAVGGGSFGVGDFALFVVYLDQLVWYPAEIGRLISDLKRIEVSYARMSAVAPGEPPSSLVASPVPAPVVSQPETEKLVKLEVRRLCYATRIKDVSFTLDRGSFTVVTGRIGSGKSTLLQLLMGLLPADRGEILWNNHFVEDPAMFFVPPRSAYTPQVPRLFSESLRDNLTLGRQVTEESLQRAIHAAVLEPDLAQLEHGLDTTVGPRGVKLSGGQVQRAAAARMFIADAELLLLDDLSSALDAETEAELWSRLFARGRAVTCLVVSHRPAALRRADQVLLMDSGRMVARGRWDELADLVAASLDVHLPLQPALRPGEPDGGVDIGQGLEWRESLLALGRTGPRGREELSETGSAGPGVHL